ncbi:MAG: prenyltransferase/squalene oxidase repeat-containing protein [Nitrospira sp.]|nr:prenyltransferase/squalene oxidase repeat-containing protein [Nitrospira sp.]
MRSILRDIKRQLDLRYHESKVPIVAKRQKVVDAQGVAQWVDPGVAKVIDNSLRWIFRAQDHSRTNDGGVARHFSLINGWGPSYPETTGYIVPTLIDFSQRDSGELGRECHARAEQMLDWLLKIQLPGGGFQGGTVDAQPRVPVTFNTGQILMGLSSGVKEFGRKYEQAMHTAANWLCNTSDPDGCWRKHPTPFAAAGEKAYETHVSWGLLEAARASGVRRYADTALANVRWALTKQQPNGWFACCCLDNPEAPLTHTIGYVLRGVLEAYLFFNKDPALLAAARLTADGALSALEKNGRLPGRLTSKWKGAVPYVCLTGTSQIAHCWLILARETGEMKYLEGAKLANSYVRRTIAVDGPENQRGAVRGSFPVNGTYGYFQYLNWAAKFTIDANLLEFDIAVKT